MEKLNESIATLSTTQLSPPSTNAHTASFLYGHIISIKESLLVIQIDCMQGDDSWDDLSSHKFDYLCGALNDAVIQVTLALALTLTLTLTQP